MSPKSHLPSDKKLRLAILRRFSTAGNGEYRHVRVGVLNGIAHLAGPVASLELYQAAAGIAGSVTGIRGVVNRLEAPGAPSPSRIIDLDLPFEFSSQPKGDAQ